MPFANDKWQLNMENVRRRDIWNTLGLVSCAQSHLSLWFALCLRKISGTQHFGDMPLQCSKYKTLSLSKHTPVERALAVADCGEKSWRLDATRECTPIETVSNLNLKMSSALWHRRVNCVNSISISWIHFRWNSIESIFRNLNEWFQTIIFLFHFSEKQKYKNHPQNVHK